MPILDRDPETARPEAGLQFVVTGDSGDINEALVHSLSIIARHEPPDEKVFGIEVLGFTEYNSVWHRVCDGVRVAVGLSPMYRCWLFLEPPALRGWIERLREVLAKMEATDSVGGMTDAED